MHTNKQFWFYSGSCCHYFIISISWHATIVFSETPALIIVLACRCESAKSWFGYYTVLSSIRHVVINSYVKHTAHSVGMRSMGVHDMDDFSVAVQCMIWHSMDVSDLGEQRT
jgi:hypothetical protein